MIKCFIFAVFVMLYLFLAWKTEKELKKHETRPGIARIMGLTFPIAWSLIAYYWIKYKLSK